jgi:hypothetical protein
MFPSQPLSKSQALNKNPHFQPGMEYTTSEEPGRGLEGIVGLAVGIAEIQRLHTVANNPVTHVRSPIEKWYWGNSGDFFQGYGMAMGIDILGEYTANKIADYAEQKSGTDTKLYQAADYVRCHHTERSIVAAVLSSGVVVAAETFGILNYPLTADIPAGIAGALLYVAVRAYVTTRHKRLHSQNR